MIKLLILAIVIGLVVVAVKMFLGDEDMRATMMAKMRMRMRMRGDDDAETPATQT